VKLDKTTIGQNVNVATEYNKLYYALNSQLTGSDGVKKIPGGTAGFIPFNVNLTIDGMSGIKIYNKITLDTSFLPNGYPTSLDFIVTGVDHKIQKGDWETNLTLTMMPKFDSVEVVDIRQSFKVADEPRDYAVNKTTSSGPVKGDEEDFWTLLAICAFEDGDDQGRADVAQSIYNRLQAALTDKLYIKTNPSIAKIIKSDAQYEPAFNRSNGGPNNMKVHPNWKNIKDMNTAVKALMSKKDNGFGTEKKAKKRLKEVYLALKNPTFQEKSISFIQGRTDFLSISEGNVETRNKDKKAGDQDPTGKRGTFVMRETNTPNNVYGWAYNYFKNNVPSPPLQQFWDKFEDEFKDIN
jgi:hypothetical protein